MQIRIDGDRLHVTFEGTSPTARGPITDPARCDVRCAIKGLFAPDEVGNEGHVMAVEFEMPPHLLVSPERPAPVDSYGYVGVALIELVIRALADVLPDRAPAGGYQISVSICTAWMSDRESLSSSPMCTRAVQERGRITTGRRSSSWETATRGTPLSRSSRRGTPSVWNATSCCPSSVVAVDTAEVQEWRATFASWRSAARSAGGCPAAPAHQAGSDGQDEERGEPTRNPAWPPTEA